MPPVQIRRERVNGSSVGLLTLDDPGHRNALSGEMVGAIVDAFEDFEAADSGVGAVVVTGTPPAFCAGARLDDLGRSSSDPSSSDPSSSGSPSAPSSSDPAGGGGAVGSGIRSVYEGFLRVARSPLPTVAAVNGPAVGAGMNLALACDVCIAGRSARFETRFLTLGLHPGGGHAWMLARRVGPQTAAAMILFGEPLDGEAAARQGLAWRCVEDDVLVAEAVSLAAAAARFPGELVRRTKETLQTAARVTEHAEAVELEIEAQAWSASQPFFTERLAELRRRLRTGRGPRP